jgi:hypothetical protein
MIVATRIGVVVAVAAAAACTVFAQSPQGSGPSAAAGGGQASWRPCDPPNMEVVRRQGRPAVRAWLAQRRAADPSGRPAEVKDLEGCFELAAHVSNEGGGAAMPEVLAELRERLGSAQAAAEGPRQRARMAANVGEALERLGGDRVGARRHYEAALADDPDDEVALRGLARLERAEAVEANKEIEAVQLREWEAWWAAQRSRGGAGAGTPPAQATTEANR